MAVFYFFEPVLTVIAKRFVPFLTTQPFSMDDDIDNYWASLDKKARDWYIKEENNSR